MLSRAFTIEAFGQPLVESRLAVDQPRGKELLLRTRRCGVCHSDLHLADGHFDLGGGRKLLMADRDIRPPIVPGHEVVAELVAAGPDALLQGLEIGRSYLVWPWIGCGRCAQCRKGKDNLCMAPRVVGIQRAGGYAEWLTVPDGRYLLDIDGIEASSAATLACSGLTAYSALAKVARHDDAQDDWLGLIGVGGVGAAGLAIAKGLGYELVAAVDIDPAKLAWARSHGADAVVNARDPNPAALLRRATGGLAAVIDFVGSAESAQLGIDVLLRGGIYVIVGMYGGELALPLPTVPTRAITIQGSYTGTMAELQELLALVRTGRMVPLEVAHIRAADINLALDRLRDGTAGARQVIAYD